MKVLVVCTVPFEKNGITSVILNYYNGLKSNVKMDFVVINKIEEEYVTLFEQNNSTIHYIPNRKRNPLNYMLKLYKILKKEKYDAIHIHGNSTLITIELLCAYFARIKKRIAHSHNTTCDHIKLNRLLRPLFNLLYTHGLACGKEAGQWMFENKSFTVLNNGIDVEKYRFNSKLRNEIRTKLNLGDDVIVLGHVAGFVTQKNHKYLIENFAKICDEINNLKLICLGSGPLLDEIKDYASSLNLDNKVLFTGSVSDTYNYYNAFDYFVLPSLYEGLPVVLVEAQANGLNCIVSNKISKEVAMTKLIRFNNIDKYFFENTELKVNITGREDDSNNSIEILRMNNFDVNLNANKLLDVYEGK